MLDQISVSFVNLLSWSDNESLIDDNVLVSATEEDQELPQSSFPVIHKVVNVVNFVLLCSEEYINSKKFSLSGIRTPTP